MSERKSFQAKTNAYRSDNVYSAKRILDQAGHFGPAMVDWARRVLSVPPATVIEASLTPRRTAVEKSGQARLF